MSPGIKIHVCDATFNCVQLFDSGTELNEVFCWKKYVFVSSSSVKYGNWSPVVGHQKTANWFVLLGFVATVSCATVAIFYTWKLSWQKDNT